MLHTDDTTYMRIYLDKLASFAQDRVAWAALVSYITHRTKLKWVQKDDERKGREAPGATLQSHE